MKKFGEGTLGILVAQTQMDLLSSTGSAEACDRLLVKQRLRDNHVALCCGHRGRPALTNRATGEFPCLFSPALLDVSSPVSSSSCEKSQVILTGRK